MSPADQVRSMPPQANSACVVPGVHLRLLGAAQVVLVALVAPVGVRHQPGELAGDVDPRAAPDPEPLGPLLQHRAAAVHVQAELVEEDVRRDGQRPRELERPVGGVLGVVEHAVAELELAVVDDRARGRDHALLERGHGGDRLERRARRIGGGDRAVEERRAELLAGELVVARLRDRLGELVRVEARVGAEREDLAVARVHGHEGAGLGAVLRRGRDGAGEGVVGGALEVEVERQPQALALARLAARHAAAVVATAERVDDDAREAVGAAQVLVVGLLDAVGPDPRAGLDAAVALPLELGGRDLARGPEQLGGELVVRVVAQVLLLDRDAGELLLALADEVERARDRPRCGSSRSSTAARRRPRSRARGSPSGGRR